MQTRASSILARSLRVGGSTPGGSWLSVSVSAVVIVIGRTSSGLVRVEQAAGVIPLGRESPGGGHALRRRAVFAKLPTGHQPVVTLFELGGVVDHDVLAGPAVEQPVVPVFR